MPKKYASVAKPKLGATLRWRPLIGDSALATIYREQLSEFKKFSLADFIFILFTSSIFVLLHIERELPAATALTVVATLICFFIPKFKKFGIPSLIISVFVAMRFTLAFIPRAIYWPVDMFLIFAALLILRKILKTPRSPVQWRWRLSKWDFVSTFVIIIPAILCLVLYYLYHPEVAQTFPFPPMKPWQVPFFIALAATINALREEILYRRGLQDLLTQHWNGPAALLVSSFAFGSIHFLFGFPQGAMGVFLTTLFGFAVGLQMRITKSFVAAWFTHTLADAIMFSVIFLTI